MAMIINHHLYPSYPLIKWCLKPVGWWSGGLWSTMVLPVYIYIYIIGHMEWISLDIWGNKHHIHSYFPIIVQYFQWINGILNPIIVLAVYTFVSLSTTLILKRHRLVDKSHNCPINYQLISTPIQLVELWWGYDQLMVNANWQEDRGMAWPKRSTASLFPGWS